ncbi:MAG TPA: RNA polymerase sigma factor [Candidatus Limivivens merdigallinarum]|uniref:RNA polymerase sigma factor n=1 Tax=Candidatus Limivivens merdigallinarum TaxID=2840859 RepID=A0A9D0ZVZ9_9FIRM|nr:RNA polymerase sigma factor [Candidatus Limivivens merdigallinarum]
MTREDTLMRKIEQGDKEAQNELIAMYYPEILRYCLFHAPSRALAEDAAQETFLKALRYFDRYEHRGHFRAFLYQIAANVCIDFGRKQKVGEISLEELAVEKGYEETGFERVQADMELLRLVGLLPGELRETVLLRYAGELSMKEIGKILGIPLRTVQSRLHSAKKRLKRELERGEGG